MNKYNKKRGYAILFTLVIISIITTITIGVANSVYKQLILSSLAHDSQVAFYAADTAAECALYAAEGYPPPGTGLPILLAVNPPWNCGVDDNGNSFVVSVTQDSSGIYHLKPINPTGSCFDVSIDKNAFMTSIIVKGYNTCDSTSTRQVERGILIEY